MSNTMCPIQCQVAVVRQESQRLLGSRYDRSFHWKMFRRKRKERGTISRLIQLDFFLHGQFTMSCFSVPFQQTEEMIRHLKVAFSSLVDEADWMDDQTKIQAREKAAAMKQFLAYPDWVRSKQMLDSIYQQVHTVYANIKSH